MPAVEQRGDFAEEEGVKVAHLGEAPPGQADGGKRFDGDRDRAHVIATSSFSGILEPGLIPALIPIGPLAGLSGVVTLLLIVALASNKIQGIAMVRALGMLIAGLPCLPWFIDSAWNLASGVFGLRRRSGSPATTAPGGRISLSAWPITARSPGRCFADSWPRMHGSRSPTAQRSTIPTTGRYSVVCG